MANVPPFSCPGYDAPQPTRFADGDAVLIRDDALVDGGAFDQLRRGTLVSSPKDGLLRLRASAEPPFRCSLLPDDFVNPAPLPAAALRNVRRVMDGAVDSPLGALLARRPPKFRGAPTTAERGSDVLAPFRARGRDAVGAAVEAIAHLDRSTLAVQGPPGTGKTFLAARAIARLLEGGDRRGVRVAVCAPSHATVANCLLAALAATGGESTTGTRVVKIGARRRAAGARGEDPERDLAEYPGVASRPRLDAKVVAEFFAEEDRRPVLCGATAWALARDEAVGLFDYLFVDEAGQVPCANVAAMAACAANVVLLGDQMQLPAPQRAAHPSPLARASALEYYSRGRRTTTPEGGETASSEAGGGIGDDQGVFLAETRRLHPSLCGAISELVYGGRLTAHASAARRTVPGRTSLVNAHAGLAVVDVAPPDDDPSDGDAAASLATANVREARVVAKLVAEMLAHKRLEDGDTTRGLDADDVLVVCPYNAHVRAVEGALRAAGAAGVKVGTVDRFQGREAPVVVASLCVAPGDDPDAGEFDSANGGGGGHRGLSFVLDVRRLNVALSRAQCLAVLVCAPDLADGAPSSLDRMRELAMLARLRELAVETAVAGDDDDDGGEEIPF